MKLNQIYKPLIILGCVLLLVAIVILKGFTAVMLVFWMVTLFLFMMFCLARGGSGTNGFLLRFLVEQGAKRDLEPKQVYLIGQIVSASMFLIIPFLWSLAA